MGTPAGTITHIGELVGVGNGGVACTPVYFPTEMRTPPTLAIYSPTYAYPGYFYDDTSGLRSSLVNDGLQSTRLFVMKGNPTTSAQWYRFHYTASAEL